MTDAARELAETYFDAWTAHDFDRLRSVLADDATFRGPLGSANGADECVQGLQGMSKIMTDIDVVHRFVDGDDVITWFDLHTNATDKVVSTANLMHTENGKITTIRVTFDPRPLLGG